MEKEVSHAEIYSRLILVEQKVDRIDKNTEGVVAAFQAAIGRVFISQLPEDGLQPVGRIQQCQSNCQHSLGRHLRFWQSCGKSYQVLQSGRFQGRIDELIDM